MCVIRSSEIKDFDEVMLLFKQLWPGKKMNETDLKTVFSRSIQSDSDEYLCAELNGKVVGFCSL